MKLIYIANSRIPTEKAHGIQIMKMCEAFSEFLQVQLILPKRFNWINEEPFKYYGMAESFEITKLPCFDLIRFHKYLGNLGLWLESLTFYFSALFFLLFRKHEKHDPAVYTRDKSLLPLYFFCKNFIFEAHSFPRNYFLYSSFLRKIKGIVVITEKLKEQFAERGIAESKILASPDGVDLENFDIQENLTDCRKKLGLPQDKRIVLYTGHLYDWKGPQTLAAASQLLPENIEIYFVGGTKEDIEKFSAQGGPASGGKINVVGHRPYSEIPYWLKAADVLVLPNSGKAEISRNWTSPMKLFEYMASGRPIVASNLPALREVLNEQNAVLVDSDNPEQLAQALKDVLQDSELSAKISAKAFDDVKKFTWHKRVRNIYENYFNKKD